MKFAWQIADGMSYLSSKSVSLRSLELFGTLNQIEMVLNVFLFRNNPATSNIYITRNWGISYLSRIRVSNSRKMPLHLLTIGRDTCLMGRQIWIVIMITIFTMTMIIVMMTMTIIMIFTIMINIIIFLSWGKKSEKVLLFACYWRNFGFHRFHCGYRLVLEVKPHVVGISELMMVSNNRMPNFTRFRPDVSRCYLFFASEYQSSLILALTSQLSYLLLGFLAYCL